MRRPAAVLFASTALALAAACQGEEPGAASVEPAVAAHATASATPTSGLAEDSNFAVDTEQVTNVDLAAVPAGVFSPDGANADILTAQVLLDRARFSPGVIDGHGGDNVRQAIEAYEQANGLTVDGQVDPQLLAKLKQNDARPILREYTVTDADAKGPFAASIPEKMEAQAELERLSYTSAAEALAEKFHMDVDFLKALNPNADFGKAGTKLIVADRGSDELGVKVARIEVDKGLKAVRAYDAQDRLVAFYPATIGSDAMQSPGGEMTVRAVAPAPTYHYDPTKLSWGDSKQKLTIAAGPNNPVGSVWIDLSKDTYGIHGTPDPSLIGKTSSHGCVRLTNWDAEELASGTSGGVKVVFLDAGQAKPATSKT